MTPEERELLTLKMKVKAMENQSGWGSSIHRKVLRVVSFYLIITVFALTQDISNAPLKAIIPTLVFILIEILHPLFGKLISRFIKFDE